MTITFVFIFPFYNRYLLEFINCSLQVIQELHKTPQRVTRTSQRVVFASKQLHQLSNLSFSVPCGNLQNFEYTNFIPQMELLKVPLIWRLLMPLYLSSYRVHNMNEMHVICCSNKLCGLLASTVPHPLGKDW